MAGGSWVEYLMWVVPAGAGGEYAVLVSGWLECCWFGLVLLGARCWVLEGRSAVVRLRGGGSSSRPVGLSVPLGSVGGWC